MALEYASTADPVSDIAARLPATDRRGWTLLGAMALLIIAGLLWAMYGRAPDTVTGAGMIVPAGGFVDIGTSVSGRVTQVLVGPGDRVQRGQPVATVAFGNDAVEQVLATVPGTVATIVARQGGITEPGTPLLTIDPATADVAIGFLPATEGSQVRTGMAAEVSVASFPRSQYGYITGTVKSVALLPATLDRIQILVGGNDQLPEYFTASGPVLEVTVALDVDADTASGYAWTTGDGPPDKVFTGELASVSVIISDRRPIERIAG
jgi:multidrug efflux pump subunit AcrA (membrane-fusion protein)